MHHGNVYNAVEHSKSFLRFFFVFVLFLFFLFASSGDGVFPTSSRFATFDF